MCQLFNDAFMTHSLEKNTLTSFLTLKSSLRRLPRRRLPPPAESPPLLESEWLELLRTKSDAKFGEAISCKGNNFLFNQSVLPNS